MKVSVREASKRIGEAFPFSVEETAEPFTYGGREIVFASPVQAEGTVTGDGKAFSVEGHGHAVMNAVCDRCLEPFEQRMDFSFSERFVREDAAEEDDYVYAGDTLDLTQPFFDNMLLDLPLVSLCKEDCKGLCPQCGANLNRSACQCAANEKNSAFAILSTMSFDK